MKDKQIQAVKNWHKLKSVGDDQILLGFTNFYCHFIHNFSIIAASFILMLKMIRLANISALIMSHISEVVSDDDLERNLPKFKKIKMIKFKTLAKSKNSTNLFKSQNIGMNIEDIKFLSFKAGIAFTLLKKVFGKAPIF